jgi:hypothetical protein
VEYICRMRNGGISPMDATIFVVGPDNQLVELRRSAYGSEDVFQKLLADHPAMLRAAAGEDGKLILVRREQPVPDESGGSDRWSIDHLFLDAQGVPVLVEVKQASDTRARREVVAQMLDYAANGVAYWPINQIVTSFRETSAGMGRDADDDLRAFLGDGDPEAFWRQVEANLGSGRIRMLFVADRIPKELIRIIEFLNEQMRPAEVLAIEVEHFMSSTGMRTLVPRLLGETERARTAKSVEVPTQRLTEEEWLADLAARRGDGARQGADVALAWFRANGFDVVVTKSQDALCTRVTRADGKPAWPFFVRRSSGRLEVSLGNLAYVPAFRPEGARQELLDRIRSLPSTTLNATNKLNGWPSISLEEVLKADLWAAFQSLALDVKLAIERP